MGNNIEKHLMNIRQATVADAKIVAELNAHVHSIHANALPDIFKPPVIDDEFISLYADWIRQDNVTIYIAEDDRQPIGYIYALIRNRPHNPFSYARHDMIVDQMSVNPDYYGTGVADKLMQAVKDLAQQYHIRRIILDVWAFNGHAKRFYEKQGFTTSRYQMQLVLELTQS